MNKMSDEMRVMQADDLSSSDSRAVKELKELYAHFCACSDAHLEDAAKVPGERDRSRRSSLLTLSQAYGWAAENVADSLKVLGHQAPRTKP